LTVAVAIRAIGAVWLYHLLSVGGEFHTSWMDANPQLIPRWNSALNPSSSSNWLWLFNAWDSPHFQLIAQWGYAHPEYVYLPGYPIFIRVVGFLFGNYWFGGFLVAQLFALGSIVMFQLVAELYMDSREAMYATLLMATFPYLSVFTILSYSEPLFLFSTVSAWYFYKKGRMRASSVLAGIASITRIYGIAITIPVFLDVVRSKKYRGLIYLVIPIACLISWFAFCYISAGDPFASWTDEKWFTSNISSKFSLVQTVANQLLGRLIGAVPVPFYIDPAILMVLCLFAYLIVRTWQIDHVLSTFPLVVFGATIFTATNHLALLRFLTFLFPIWLTMKVRNPLFVGVGIAFFVPLTLLLWLYAINVTFIG
jgi:Gpi18-like mannosyltransferase